MDQEEVIEVSLKRKWRATTVTGIGSGSLRRGCPICGTITVKGKTYSCGYSSGTLGTTPCMAGLRDSF